MRPFQVIDCAQRTPEWFAARCGRLTASRSGDMLATIKSGEAAARRDLRMQLVAERLTGQAQEDGYTNAAMQRGIDLEPAALAAYESLTGHLVHTTGFIAHTDLMAGCSLDGYLGNFDALVSLKCPKTATHLGYIRAGVMPSAYVPQMLCELWVTGAKAYHFLSFDDRLPEPLQRFLCTVTRDEHAIGEFERKALAFLAEVDQELAALQTLTNLRGQLEAATA